MGDVIPIHGRHAKKLAEEIGLVIEGKDMVMVLEAIAILSQGLCVVIDESVGYDAAKEYKEDLIARMIHYTKDY